MGAGLDGSDPITLHVKQLGAELLSVKADLERELKSVVLDCNVMWQDRALRRRSKHPIRALVARRTGSARHAHAVAVKGLDGVLIRGQERLRPRGVRRARASVVGSRVPA
jgi:hypothetical protein